jgi:hypothetical protein
MAQKEANVTLCKSRVSGGGIISLLAAWERRTCSHQLTDRSRSAGPRGQPTRRRDNPAWTPSKQELADALGWRSRTAGTPLDALLEPALLRRDKAGRYANTIRSATFLDRSSRPGVWCN